MMENAVFTEKVPKHGVIDGHVMFELHAAGPDDIIIVGQCANLVASVLFERARAEGTNIVLNLTGDGGEGHVVARSKDDGLDFQWKPVTIQKEQLMDLQERIRDATLPLEHGVERPLPEPQEERVGQDDDDETLVKQLIRIP